MEPLEILTALNLAEVLLAEVIRASVIRAAVAAAADVEAEQLGLLCEDRDLHGGFWGGWLRLAAAEEANLSAAAADPVDRLIQFEAELWELGLLN